MAADFDEESQLAHETVTRQASNPSVLVAMVMAAVVALILGLVWYTSSRKGTKPQNAGDESFATARLQPGVSFDRPPPKPEDNRILHSSARARGAGRPGGAGRRLAAGCRGTADAPGRQRSTPARGAGKAA